MTNLPLLALLKNSLGSNTRYADLLLKTVPAQRFQTEHGFLVEDYLKACEMKLRAWGIACAPNPNDDAGWRRAKEAGFTFKTWLTRKDDRVRKVHQRRNLEERRIDERFSVQYRGWIGPMHPRDPLVAPADRINCRCKLAFSMQ